MLKTQNCLGPQVPFRLRLGWSGPSRTASLQHSCEALNVEKEVLERNYLAELQDRQWPGKMFALISHFSSWVIFFCPGHLFMLFICQWPMSGSQLHTMVFLPSESPRRILDDRWIVWIATGDSRYPPGEMPPIQGLESTGNHFPGFFHGFSMVFPGTLEKKPWETPNLVPSGARIWPPRQRTTGGWCP